MLTFAPHAVSMSFAKISMQGIFFFGLERTTPVLRGANAIERAFNVSSVTQVASGSVASRIVGPVVKAFEQMWYKPLIAHALSMSAERSLDTNKNGKPNKIGKRNSSTHWPSKFLFCSKMSGATGALMSFNCTTSRTTMSDVKRSSE